MYLGIDIGTSAVKCVAVSESGHTLEQTSAALTVNRPLPLYSEQNPADWWEATNKAVAGISPSTRRSVASIGLTGQMHGATAIGKDGSALRPAILWNDGRSLIECRELETAVPELGDITGNRAMPGFTAPKLLWMQKHEPSLFKDIIKILLPKDYIRLRMTGDYASDCSDAAGTLWLNTQKRSWSENVLSACNLSTDHMPRLFEGNTFTGELRKELAEAWGMSRVPVAAGGSDNAAGAVGSGTVRAGDAVLSLGTSGVTFVADDQYRPNPEGGVHTFCHALPSRWHQMSVMLSAASAVDWVAEASGFSNPASLYQAAEDADVPCLTEIFLPYLTGERTPHNDPLAQGLLFGLTQNSSSTTLAQAALEGVAFGLADGIDAIHETGAKIDTVSVIGGGSRSDYWGRILASVLDRPLIYREGSEIGPAYGAARLARLALTGENTDDVCVPPSIRTVIKPSEKLRDHYAQRRPIFQELYKRLAPLFKENSVL